MPILKRLVSIARPYAGKLLLVAVLTSTGALAELVEPWVYRAIVNDIAGVFISKQNGFWAEILEELRGGGPEPEATETPSSASPGPGQAPGVPEGGAVQPAPEQKSLPPAGTRRHRRRLRRPERSGTPLLPPQTVSHAVRTLWLGVLVLLTTAAVGKFFAAWADLLAARATNQIEENFILQTFRHVLRLPLAYFTARPSGATARQIDQSDQIAPLYTAVTQEVWSELFTATVILAVMVSVNVELSVVVLVALLVYVLVTVHTTRQLETHLEEYYGLWDDVSGRIQEVVAGIKTVRVHANEDYETQRTTETVIKAFRTYLRRKQVETRSTFIQNALIYLSKGLVLGLGGMKALEHQLTPGDVVMFVAYLDRIYSPVYNLTGLYSVIQRHVASIHRALRLLDLKEEERPAGLRPDVREGRTEFRDVEFAYREGQPVLRGVTFTMPPGQVTALIGASGAGKTTAADLLLQLYRPQRGAVIVDGQDLADIDPGQWRKQVALVSAEGTIFRDTLAQNIRYGRLDATDEEVLEAALQAGLGPALERLPLGLHTVLGERGYELSMGERQRVLLARAFAARPRLLILDEATSNLDFKTEAAVKQSLRQLTQGRTTLIIAHRQSMLTEVDRVVALRDGRVIEEGTPQVLLGEKGYFFQMMTARGDGPELFAHQQSHDTP